MKNFVAAILLIFVLAIIAIGLSGCNTAHGLGEDISTLGRGLQGISD